MTPHSFGRLLGTELSASHVKAAGGVGTAAKTIGGGLGTAFKGYRKATQPLAQHAANALPQAARPFASSLVKSTGAGITGGAAYSAYDDAATATSNAAQNLARTAGVSDQKVLDEVGSRARGQMLPMAYRAMAPAWAGGDNTPLGQELRNDLGTVAKHNIVPALTRPSPVAAQWNPAQRGIMATFGNPVGAFSSAVFAPRPSAQQMWQNVPQQQRTQITNNLMQAATVPGSTGPLAQGMQHIFQPAVQHQQQKLMSGFNSLVGTPAAN